VKIVNRYAISVAPRQRCIDWAEQLQPDQPLPSGAFEPALDLLGLHQILLCGQNSLQPAPSRFQKAEHSVELVQYGLLDGAIVSSWGLEKSLPPDHLPRWRDIDVQPLGTLPLWLMARSSSAEGILVPNRGAVPLLHQTLESNGHNLVSQPRAAQEPAAWLKRMRDRELALPLCRGLVGEAWLSEQSLSILSEFPPLQETLWLLLPQGLEPRYRQAAHCAPYGDG
jgi:hypothetical protein